MGITLAGPSQLYIKWSCRRCGHQNGIARTTFPVGTDWNEEMMKTLFDTLRTKLIVKHQKQGCIAAHGDFHLESFVPQGKTLLDKL